MSEHIIKRVQVITQQGVGGYAVEEVINGLKIAQIKDFSAEFQESIYCNYTAYTEDGKIVSAIINCPVVVEYMKENEE